MSETPKVYVPPVIDHSEWDQEGDRILLYQITTPGKTKASKPVTVDYTMPGKPHVGLALAFLKMVRTLGSTVSVAWLLEQAVGEEGYDALSAEPDLTPEAFEAITSKVSKVILGGLSAPKAS